MQPNPRELPQRRTAPFVSTWRQLYGLVIGALVAEILLFYALMLWFS